ncbi:MAG: hypothetical protein H7269_09105, partial [Cellulomonas sp.]|nr:hypothetical protein [Cellulomonas sp.]
GPNGWCTAACTTAAVRSGLPAYWHAHGASMSGSLFYLLFQKNIIRGVMAGRIKG